jgi:hypothetical protein
LRDDENPFKPYLEEALDKTKPPRLNYWKVDISAYEQPQWWNPRFGWIAFYNKDVLASSSPLLNPLRYSRSQFVFDEKTGYTLSPLHRDRWLRLDNQLNRAYRALMEQYPMALVEPVAPQVFGYLRCHRSHSILSICLEKSRGWFRVWMALLSFCIAGAQTIYADRNLFLAQLPWRELLVENCKELNMDRIWVDMVLDTSIALFSPDVSRAGTFVHLLPEDQNTQPSVEWFVEHGVPVWYEWNLEAIVQSPHAYERFAPLEYQLQDAMFFRTKALSPIDTDMNYTSSWDHSSLGASPPTSYRRTPTPDPPQAQVTQQTPPYSIAYMTEFFRLRDERIARIMMHETPVQRSTRLSRAAQPPTKNARVFEWTESASGEFTYEEIPKKQRSDLLDNFGDDQLRYDPVLNEWHCCELWGDYPGDDDESPLFPFEDDNRPPEEAIPPPNPSRDLPVNDDAVQDFLPNQEETQHQPVDIRLLRLQEEILTVVHLYFGYTARIPLPDVPTLTGIQLRKSFCRSFGLIWDQVSTVEQVFMDKSVAAAIDFFRRLAKNSVLVDDEWDLFINNPAPVSLSPRFRQIRSLQTTTFFKDGSGIQSKTINIYMLDLGNQSVAPWNLAVKSALDALLICRLDPAFNEYHIAEFLLTNGIPFHTLQPRANALQASHVQRQSLAPFRRPHEYIYGSRDYLAYRERCHTILSHPRGRAALMHGHFMWRLALRSVRWEAVYKGPSGWSSDPDEMLVAQDPSSGAEYFDDKLTMEEQEVLCGTYHCLTGWFYD